MLDEHVPFLEAALVEQQLDALARGELAPGMLRVDALLAAAKPRLGALVLELLNDLLHDVLLLGYYEINSKLCVFRLRFKQFSCRGRGRDPALLDVRGERGQQRAHPRMVPEPSLHPGADAFPHPAERLMLAALGQRAARLVRTAELRDRAPEPVQAVAGQRGEAQHLRLRLG